VATAINYQDTGYQYIKGVSQVLFSNGIVLPIRDFERFDRSGSVVKEILKQQASGVQLYDFQHAVKEGTLKRLASTPTAPKLPQVPHFGPPKPPVMPTALLQNPDTGKAEVIIAKPIPDEKIITEVAEELKDTILPVKAISDLIIPPIKEAGEKPPSTTAALPEEVADAGLNSLPAKAPHNFLGTPSVIEPSAKAASSLLPYWKTVPFMVELVMLLVAGGSAIMSAYHTTMFMYTSGKPVWISFLTGFIIMCFTATAFTAGRFFLQEKNASMIFGFIFIILGFFIIAYSMFATITVNFNQFRWEEQKEVAEAIENSVELEVANETKGIMLKEVQRLDREIETLRAEAEGWRNQSWRRYDEYVTRIDALTGLREAAWTAYITAGAERVVVASKAETERVTIYSFFAGLFGIDEDILRFFVYAIPSVFYDVAAPFGFTIILLLEDKRRRKKDD